MKRLLWILVVTLAVISVVGAMMISHISLSALPEPSKTETRLAARAKRFLVSRASRGIIAPAPKDLQSSLTEGDKVFGTDCSPCHGALGRKPTDAGRWMYPRAADLGSADAQRYSNAELFWIVKNGIRLSGMPAFGKVESDDTIWDVVHFIRTLPSKPVQDGRGPAHYSELKKAKSAVHDEVGGVAFTILFDTKQQSASVQTSSGDVPPHFVAFLGNVRVFFPDAEIYKAR